MKSERTQRGGGGLQRGPATAINKGSGLRRGPVAAADEAAVSVVPGSRERRSRMGRP